MKLEITDPSDGNPGCTGYFSADIIRDGELDASIEVSPQYLADLFGIEEPEDIVEALENAADGARAAVDLFEQQGGLPHDTSEGGKEHYCNVTRRFFYEEELVDGERCPHCGTVVTEQG